RADAVWRRGGTVRPAGAPPLPDPCSLTPIPFEPMYPTLPSLLIAFLLFQAAAPGASRQAADATLTVLRPPRVFDGEAMHEGWAVRIRGTRIDAAGPPASITTDGATISDLLGTM